jgi:dynein heavy chain
LPASLSPSLPACLPAWQAVSTEIASLPDRLTVGWVKINAKPLRTALSTWASK